MPVKELNSWVVMDFTGSRNVKKLSESTLSERRSLIRAKNTLFQLPEKGTFVYRMLFKIHLCCLQEETSYSAA